MKCRNTCSDQLQAAQQAALEAYRNVQIGLRKKQEILMAYEDSLLNQKKSFDGMKDEKQKLSDLYFTLRFLYEKKEHPLERHIRFQLVRERQIKCLESLGLDVSHNISRVSPDSLVNSQPKGDQSKDKPKADSFEGSTADIVQKSIESSSRLYIGSCDLFYGGYINANEFLEYNVLTTYAKPRTRMTYKHSEDEIKAMNSQSGIDRIKASLCLETDLLPDDNPNIFVTLGEYLEVAAGTKGMRLHVPLWYDYLFHCISKTLGAG